MRGILICSCYRPPNDEEFLSKLEVSLSKLDPAAEFYILGDMNIDISQDSALLTRYRAIMNIFNCSQIINEATRVTPDSSTVLDHIMTNSVGKVKGKGVIPSGFSDHFMVYCSRGSVAGDGPLPPIIKRVRSLKNYTKERLVLSLRSVNWLSVLTSTDVSFCLDEFCRLFMSAVDGVAPFRDVRVRQKSEPWVNAHILSGIKERDRIFRLFKRDRSNRDLYAQYCKIRNSVQRDIKVAKTTFFRNKVVQNRGNSSKLWEQLKSLGYSKKGSGERGNIILNDGESKVFEPSRVAAIFNRFYTTVASDLVSRLPPAPGIFGTSSHAFKSFYRPKVNPNSSFVLSPVPRRFILKQLLSLDPKKSIGLDGISPRFLCDGAVAILEPVSHIINLSITTETVPDGMKRARVVPLFKKGSKLDAGNYRPVSILSSLSKILERAVHGQLKDYLVRRDLIYQNQSGFRGGFSTDTCLIGLTDYVKCEMGKGRLVGMVLLDLRKAFDTVNHDIMIEKLRAFGIGSTDWFQSYLSGRQQTVDVNGKCSAFLDISCGVPQGSILGPLLFLLYVNDMHISVSCKLALYADDSALIFSHTDWKVIQDTLSFELGNCHNWLLDNKLSLHVGKTECIVFGTGRRLSGIGDFRVECGGTSVKRVNSVDYLGVRLNGNMNGKDHAENVVKKCAGRLSFLYRKASFLDFHCRKLLTSALIQPYFDYCASSWYEGVPQRLKLKFDVLQRRMVRFIHSQGPMEHIGLRDFGALSWLTVPDRARYFRLLHVFRIRSGLSPSYLSDHFRPLSSIHTYGTRGSSHDYHVSKEISLSPSSFAYMAITNWNALPDSLKGIQSLSVFKAKLKHFLLSHY